MTNPSRRRTRGEGSMYERKDGTWVGVVNIGWRNNKRVRRSVTAPTLRELRPKMKELQKSVELGVISDNVTVGQWMTYWLEELQPRKVRDGLFRDTTLQTYRSYNRTWITPHLGRYRLDKLTPTHIEAMHTAMEQAGRSGSTRRQAHFALQSALKTAVQQKKIPFNPAQVTDKPAAGKNNHGYLNVEETLTVLELLAEYGDDGLWRIASRYLAALLGGIRKGEALGLRWEDVNLTPGSESMLIQQAVYRIVGKGLVVTPTKTDDTRVVPMIGPLAHAMRMHAQTTATPHGFVWGQGLKPADPEGDYKVWKGLVWSAGLEHRALHAARATTASILGEAKVQAKAIADILGHKQIHTGWKHYIHVDDRQMREGLNQGLAMLQAPPPPPPDLEA